jgi:hypothetical protein
MQQKDSEPDVITYSAVISAQEGRQVAAPNLKIVLAGQQKEVKHRWADSC